MLRRPILFCLAAAAAGAQTDPSSLAAGVLDQTKQARQAVASRDRDAAVAHVRNAMATVSMIQQNSPDAPRPLMVTIYRSVDTTTTVTPVKKNSEWNRHSSIRGVEGDAITAQLDITAAGDRLPGAQAALESGDWNSADSILAAIENSVTTAQTTGPMPLRMARQNLELARMRVREGKYHQAEMPLKSAAQALGDYGKSAAGPQAAEIEAARQDMEGFSTRVSKDRDAAPSRIDSWLAMVSEWSKQGAR